MSAPPGHWLLGHVPAFRGDPLGLLDRCDGGVVPLRLGRTAYLVLDPRDVVHVLGADEAYSKGSAFRHGRRLYGNSLLVSEGADHAEQARLVGGLFFRHAARDFLDPAGAITEQLAARWRAGDRIDLWAAMLDLTLAISSRAIFGCDYLPAWMPGGSDEAGAILHAFDAAMGHVARQSFALVPLPDWVPTPAVRRYRRAIDTLDAAVARAVERRRRGEAQGGFLDHLLKAPLSISQVRDQSLILMLGGYESTAAALCWALLLIGAHPEVQRRLLDDAPPLSYTAKVFSESLRLYPSPWLIPRAARRGDALPSGARLPRGAQVFLSPYRTQRDGRYFADPLRFDSDRFDSTAWPDGAYFPFGAGPRRCLG
jgi:pentalenene oxygenase